MQYKYTANHWVIEGLNLLISFSDSDSKVHVNPYTVNHWISTKDIDGLVEDCSISSADA